MKTSHTIFGQLLSYFSKYDLQCLVASFKGNSRRCCFNAWSQLVTMVYAQITDQDSLRDIADTFNTHYRDFYRLGLLGKIRKSTLAYANEHRDYRIWETYAKKLVVRTRALYKHIVTDLNVLNEIYALDSTTIDLCLSLFDWAKFRTTKGAIKLHTLLDLRGNIPAFVIVTDGSVHDRTAAGQITISSNAIYVIDRGYLDFAWLYQIQQAHAFFVTRLKSNSQWRRLYSAPVRKQVGILSDQTIVMALKKTRQAYPAKIRRIRFKDPDTQKVLVFLTNNFDLDAEIIAALYKCRWQVELFFKWIKQNLKIKTFYGTSPNAVQTQVWICLSVYLMLCILKHDLKLSAPLSKILQILRSNLFEKKPILCLFQPDFYQERLMAPDNQLPLFDF